MASQYEKNKQAAKQPQRAQAKAEKREPANKKVEPASEDEAKEAQAKNAEKADKAAQAENKKLTEVPIDPQGDSQAVVGAFVKVIGGEHEGRYGVLMEAHSLDNAVVRTRDSSSERIVTKYTDLVPAEAGGR